MLVPLDRLGQFGDKVCSSGPGTDGCIFPGVTGKDVFLFQRAARQETKGLGQWEETSTCSPGLGLLSKNWRSCSQKFGPLGTAALCSLQKPILFLHNVGFYTCEWPFWERVTKMSLFQSKKAKASEHISVLTLSSGTCCQKETSEQPAELSIVFLLVAAAVACLKATGMNTARIYGLFSYFIDPWIYLLHNLLLVVQALRCLLYKNLLFKPVGNFARVRSASLASALPFFFSIATQLTFSLEELCSK